jgi:hypothetical protein
MNCVIPKQPLSEMNKAQECMKTQATAINQTTTTLAFKTTQTGALSATYSILFTCTSSVTQTPIHCKTHR